MALIGRINVGKSSLFNTISESNQAIISSIPGTTRDINIAQINWRGKLFNIIDTGGLDAGQLGQIETAVEKKAYQILDTADHALLIVDGRGQITTADRNIAKFLKKQRVKTTLVINKVDGPRIRSSLTPDFYAFGFGQPHLVSAASGSGIGDLLDVIVQDLPERKIAETTETCTISIIGKTNVGKSSVLNTLLGEERVIVSPLPHTTREPHDTVITYYGKKIRIVDTAGLRKKRNVSDPIEKISVEKTRASIKRSDISLVTTDASQPLTNQDQTIASIALDNGNAIILVANKWDIIPQKNPQTMALYNKTYRRYFSSLPWAPLIFTSAKTKLRVSKLLPLALQVYQEYTKTLTQSALNRLVQSVKPKKAKPSKGKKPARQLYLRQVSQAPPTFHLITAHPERVHQSYLDLVEKKMRLQHGFAGTPISIQLRKK